MKTNIVSIVCVILAIATISNAEDDKKITEKRGLLGLGYAGGHSPIDFGYGGYGGYSSGGYHHGGYGGGHNYGYPLAAAHYGGHNFGGGHISSYHAPAYPTIAYTAPQSYHPIGAGHGYLGAGHGYFGAGHGYYH